MVSVRGRSIVSLLSIVGVFLAQTSPTFAKSQKQARGYDYGVDPREILKRDTGHFPVTGVPYTGSNASIPVRQEIRDLEKDQTLWELYILGLSMMQTINQSDISSWYQIAGKTYRG
jgi:tyrosinase